jgi:hypothetical protein
MSVILDRRESNPLNIVRKLHRLAKHMAEVGEEMNCYGEFDCEMKKHGQELVGASSLAREWADQIEKKFFGRANDE